MSEVKNLFDVLYKEWLNKQPQCQLKVIYLNPVYNVLFVRIDVLWDKHMT